MLSKNEMILHEGKVYIVSEILKDKAILKEYYKENDKYKIDNKKIEVINSGDFIKLNDSELKVRIQTKTIKKKV